MFNFSRKRSLPPNLKQEEIVFLSKPEDQKLQEDAKGLATTMVRNGLEKPEDALAVTIGVEYWQYLKGFRPKYLKKVLDLANTMADVLDHDFRSNPEKYPMPAPKQPGGMASSNKNIVHAELESTVLPNGLVLLRIGRKCSMRIGGRTITFESDPGDAVKMALAAIQGNLMVNPVDNIVNLGE